MSNQIQAEICVLEINGQWMGTKKDKQVESEVSDKHGTGRDAGRYTKNLFPAEACGKENPHFMWMRACRNVRGYWTRHTSPWEDGRRIVAGHFLDQFDKEIKVWADEAHSALENFLLWYENGRAMARIGLNSLFKDGDYPSEPQIRAGWSLSVRYNPIPQAHHFLTNIHSKALDNAKASLTQENEEKIKTAVQNIWLEVLDPVQNLVEQLSPPYDKTRLFDSLVDRIRDVANRIPALDFTGSPDLQQAQQRLITLADSINIAELRGEPLLRPEASAQAMAVLNAFSKFTRKIKA